MSILEIENVLQTYTIQEIFEHNDLTEADVLLYLIENKIVQLPNPEPLDFDD